jgi:molybdopterin molybdotransferase
MVDAMTPRSPDLVSLEAHVTRVLALGSPLALERVPLSTAIGCALGEAIHTDVDLPPFDNAAMDGYAIRAADAAAGTPLLVVGDGAAGTGMPPALGPMQAARIMTGAPIPDGADTVVPVERTDRGLPAVRVPTDLAIGAHLRRAGEDLSAGTIAADAGAPLTTGRIALLASIGRATIAVHRRPVVSVLATGTELTAPGLPLPPGGIYESNATMLATALRELGAQVRIVPHVRDDPPEALEVLRRAAAASDLVITAGGISAGDFEVVRQALEPIGTVEFAPVAITPGRPQGWGTIEGTPIVCLPGNPVSALVSYLLFGAPLVRRMLGWAEPRTRWLPSICADDFPGRDGRTQLTLGELGPAGVRSAGSRHLLTALARADCLVRLEPGVTYAAGSRVSLLPL